MNAPAEGQMGSKTTVQEANGTAATPELAEQRQVHHRARRGIQLLMGRQVALQCVTLVGGVILARTLRPAEFGLYAMATFLVEMLAVLGDFGLAASLIQRKAELTERDLQVGFTLQQVVTSLIVLVLLLCAPQLVALYPKAPPETLWLVRALAFTLYLTSWRTSSALQLERHLRYDRLAVIEVIETLTYQGVAVALALAGMGVWSFVCATLLRGLLGAVLIYAAAPWRVRFAYDRAVAREILRYGIPFQFQNLTNQLGGWAMFLVVGKWVGPQAIGYLTWATSNGKKPLLLADNVMRVAFPHFARIQDDRAEVERTLARYLTGLLLAAGLWFAVLVTAGPFLVRAIYTEKWIPAVPALILAAAALSFDVVTMVVGITLNSLGVLAHVTRVVLTRSLLNAVLCVVLVRAMGYNGAPLAYLFSVMLIVPWLLSGLGHGAMRRTLLPTAWILLPLLASLTTGLAASLATGLLARQGLLPVMARAVLLTAVTTLAYGGTLWLAAPEWLTTGVRQRLRRLSFPPL